MRRLILATVLISTAFHIFAAGENEAPAVAPENAVVQVEHKFGTTWLTEYPRKIVSIGFSDHDTILAFGVVPVAVRDWYGDMPFATWPWAADELGDAEPVVLSSSEPDYETIAALQPDVIFGISSGMDRAQYERLSKIAPVIAQSADYPDYGTPWREETRVVARVLGLEEEGEQLISGIDEKIARLKSLLPEAQGAEAAVSFVYQNKPGAYASHDTRSRLLGELGFVTPAIYDELAGDQFYITFSEERLDLLDLDLVIWIGGSDEALEQIRNLSLRDQLDVSQQGRELFFGKILSGAFSFASPLSIDYLLSELEAALPPALDGDPDTFVPERFR